MKRIKHGSNVCRCGYSENEHGPINRQLRQHGPIDRTFRATWAHQQNTQEQSGPATWAHQQNTQSNMDQQHGPINRTLGVNMGPSTELRAIWAHEQNTHSNMGQQHKANHPTFVRKKFLSCGTIISH